MSSFNLRYKYTRKNNQIEKNLKEREKNCQHRRRLQAIPSLFMSESMAL